VGAPRRIATELVDQVFQQWPDEFADEFIESAFDMSNTSLMLPRTVTTIAPSPLRPDTKMSTPASDPFLLDLVNDPVEAGVSPTHQTADRIFSQLSDSKISLGYLESERPEGPLAEVSIDPELPVTRSGVDLRALTEPGHQGMEEVSLTLAAALVLAQLSSGTRCADSQSTRRRWWG
jgi:hypothetical protein